MKMLKTMTLRRILRLSRRAKQGSALVLILACLVLMLGLVLALLSAVRSNLTISRSDADSTQVRLLADTAVNLVIAQVNDATLRSANDKTAWASQPGMIRLYDNSGNPAGYRKLYSWDNMTGPGAFDPFISAEKVPDTWRSQTAIFTDLNEPANGVFPIFDYDKAANDLNIQGLSLGTVPGATTSNPSPMPVKWLYVLADGTVHVPAANSTATKAVIPAATKDNPIVGRIAFWTDDETAKININTASEGTFWATPRFETQDERSLATYQPARGEFQRYPGHPAGVSLKAVFPALTSKEIFSLAPRLSWGGSEGATKPVQDVTSWIQSDSDRLYASVDELLLANPPASATERQAQNSKIGRDEVEASRFFLTAGSRAPELNLFGQPRIAIWPIHEIADDNYRTANDRLIAFCSTIGHQPFYFMRKENVLPSYDISIARNVELLDYLDMATGKNIPGFGGSFRNKYTQAETRQILTEIFDYVRCTNLFDATTPASGPNFPYAFGISSRNAKGTRDYGSGCSLGSAAPAHRSDWDTRGFGGRFLQIFEAHIQFVGLGRGPITTSTPNLPAVPVWPNQYGTRAGMDTATDPTANTPFPNKTAVQAYLYLSTLTPGEGIEYWSPGQWFEISGLDQFGIKLSPSDAGYTPLGFPAQAQMLFWGNMLGGGGVAGARVNGLEPHSFVSGQTQSKVFNPAFHDTRYIDPFFSNILPISAASPTMDFKGGTLTVKIYADKQWPNTTNQRGELVQTLTLKFPDANFPAPTCNDSGMRRIGTGVVCADSRNPVAATDDRWMIDPGVWGNWFIDHAHDVFKSVGLANGDIRLFLNSNPPESLFQPLVGYDDPNVRVVHSLDGNGGRSTGGILSGSRGRLIKNAAYRTDQPSVPWVPSHINGVFTAGGAPGDWDNGTSIVGDGPYINAADPGSVSPVSASAPPYYDNSNDTASYKSLFFSPNRQIPSPVMFGSLSTGVQRLLPWQTLLFRPGPPGHPGSADPKDHLLLDLFWMPVVEPYAISEPFSTAGKINMNQQLVPFTYINRMTALHAAIMTEQVAMVPKSGAVSYKFDPNNGIDSRRAINLSDTNGTLRQFKEKFASGKIFRSATEICDIYLVPQGKNWTSDGQAQTDWYGDDFALVGDNTRERPYADLYERLTTKSNTFTVHYRAQALRQPKQNLETTPTVFDISAGDKIVAERRGATTFERYLDPNDMRFVAGSSDADPDAVAFLGNPGNNTGFSLEPFYRIHIINSNLFQP